MAHKNSDHFLSIALEQLMVFLELDRVLGKDTVRIRQKSNIRRALSIIRGRILSDRNRIQNLLSNFK